MKILNLTTLLFFLANAFGCHGQKPAAPPENWILADVIVKKDGGKPTAQFVFYRDISEVVDGKEIKGFGKSPVIVDFPKINGLAMKEIVNKEIVNKDAPKLYLAEIENTAQDYTITFSRKDGEYQAVIRIDPNDLSKTIRAEFERKKAEASP